MRAINLVRLALWSCCAALSVGSPASAQVDDPLSPTVVPELQVTEVLRVGGYDERESFSFSTITTGAVLSAREIALVDRLSNEIRMFDLAGAHLRTFGGVGEGPGEFRYLRALQPLRGNRLLAWDFQGKRISLFELDGTHVHTVGLRVSPFDRLWTSFVGAFSDGSFVVRSDPSVMSMRNDPVGPRRDPTHFVHHAASGEVVDTLCTVAGPERHLYREGSSWDLEGRLFEREVVGATSGDALLCGTTERLNLRHIEANGLQRASLIIDRPSRRITKVEVELEREQLAAEERDRQERRARVVVEALGTSVGESSWVLNDSLRRKHTKQDPRFGL